MLQNGDCEPWHKDYPFDRLTRPPVYAVDPMLIANILLW